jgi:hypothetical protein
MIGSLGRVVGTVPSAQREQQGGRRRARQAHGLPPPDAFVQQGEGAQDDRKGRMDGGEDHGDGRRLPLNGERIQDQAEGGPGPDEDPDAPAALRGAQAAVTG